MEKIKSLIKSLHKIVKNSKSGHLPLKERVSLLNAINDTSVIGKLYFECLKKVYPVWAKDFPNNPIMTGIINKADVFLYRQSCDRKEFEALYNDNTNYFESIMGDTGLVGMTALSLCATLGYGTELEIEDYQGEDDNAFDWQDWTPDFYASMAYSGGNPFVGEGNVVRRKEFWDWYLETALQLYTSPDTAVLVLNISTNKPAKSSEFRRNQSYTSDTIREKLEHIVDMTIEDLYNQENDMSFDRIEYNSICLELSGTTTEILFYIKGNAIKLKEMRMWPDENQSDVIDDVKQEMYNQSPEEGAWLESHMVIYPDKSYKINFIYDDYNQLSKTARESDKIKEEFRVYPRSKEFTPQWWQDILGKKAKYLK
ncbi:Imm5 family immunity protein [Treponema pedis]|uniref:Immunity protein Imm5 domain-containing protein n=1 Tax=Treponema pedis str. T A4 TaxID=1291379 RepID=S6A8H6_9SPIR|nr:Imm5 family immunity protein [Treponema pedis]AGT43844.1 hypothetical protein TPE_1349 [Treponema pedis str. T A4]QSI04591.1 hypothetical protein DYQ05_06405 [Treponema pedis]